MNPLEYVHRLNLPSEHYLVVGSALLSVKNIKPLNDIDLLVSSELFDILKGRGWYRDIQTVDDRHFERVSQDICEAFVEFRGKTLVEWMKSKEDIEIIEDIHFLSLEKILEIKKEWQRPKDIHDIELIEEHLKKNK